MNARVHLEGLLHTALRVRNEGLERRFDMESFYSEDPHCGTTACLIGWHSVFTERVVLGGPTFPRNRRHVAHDFAHEIVCSVFGCESTPLWDSDDMKSCQYFKTWDVLFGEENGKGPAALDRQIRRIRWFLHRIEALEEYERIRAMPRKESRRLRLAA